MLLFIAIFVPLVSSNLCICIYNTGYGIKLGSSAELSSEFSRRYWINDSYCPKTEICHLYATLPSDTAHSVFINIHAGEDIEGVIINYRANGSVFPAVIQAQSIPLEGIEERGERNLFTALLTNLQPNTLYYLDFVDLEGNDLQLSTTYKTFPEATDLTANISIAFGGDVGTYRARPTTKKLGTGADRKTKAPTEDLRLAVLRRRENRGDGYDTLSSIRMLSASVGASVGALDLTKEGERGCSSDLSVSSLVSYPSVRLLILLSSSSSLAVFANFLTDSSNK